MRGHELLDKMELADAAYVENADIPPQKKKHTWIKTGIIAACGVLVLLAGLAASRMNKAATITIGGITRTYRDALVTEEAANIEWPWEYKTTSEKYTQLTFEGRSFRSRGRQTDPSLLGEALGTGEAAGYDSYEDQEHRMDVEIYQITGISPELMVAAKLEDQFYIFMHSEFAAPGNLGEILEGYTLTQNLRLERFTRYEAYTEQGTFSLKDDAYIWEILDSCRGADFIQDDTWSLEGRASIRFTATSQALGVYKQVFAVTADGYLWTNIFDWAYIFHIGEEAAAEIISYAAEQGESASPEPYSYSLTGTITGITEDYILVDDSILCSVPEEGMVFQIPLEDLRISRYIDFANLGEGDLVIIQFTGTIDTQAGNVVEGAYEMSRAFISDDGKTTWVIE